MCSFNVVGDALCRDCTQIQTEKVMNQLVAVTQLSHKMAEVCVMNRGRQSFVYTCCNGDHH